jgi:tRNA(adenine34) deaminase
MQAITAAANYLGGKYLRIAPCMLPGTLPDVWSLVLSQISKIVFGASDESRGFQKWVRNSIQNCCKTSV